MRGYNLDLWTNYLIVQRVQCFRSVDYKGIMPVDMIPVSFLPQMHVASSLAHEWWHGFDDYLGTKMGAKGMLSEQPRL